MTRGESRSHPMAALVMISNLVITVFASRFILGRWGQFGFAVTMAGVFAALLLWALFLNVRKLRKPE